MSARRVGLAPRIATLVAAAAVGAVGVGICAVIPAGSTATPSRHAGVAADTGGVRWDGADTEGVRWDGAGTDGVRWD